MASEPPATERLFFALFPPSSTQEAVHHVAGEQVSGGRLLPAVNLHITLAFLGDLEQADKRRAMAAAASVRADSFRLQLERLGCWRRRGIAWVAPAETPTALLDLHRQLTAGLEAKGFPGERRPFRPHLTVARRASAVARLAVEPISWRVTEFQLMRSRLAHTGATYATEGTWTLGRG